MAMTTDHFERALAAVLDACDTEQDMTDWTTRLITTASVMSGHQVLRGRGWEQAKLTDLVQSAGGFVDDEYFRQDDPRGLVPGEAEPRSNAEEHGSVDFDHDTVPGQVVVTCRCGLSAIYPADRCGDAATRAWWDGHRDTATSPSVAT